MIPPRRRTPRAASLALCALLTGLLCALLGLGTPVHADDASSLFTSAQEAESRGDVEAAERAYRSLVAADPHARLSSRAERRLAWLDARDEWPEALAAYLVFVARVSPPPEELVAFEAVTAAMPEGLVRRESRLALAASWDRLSARSDSAEHAARAEEAYDSALAEPGLEGGDRAQLVSSYAAFLGRHGRTDEGLLLLDREGHAAGSVRRRLVLEGRDVVVRPLAWLLLTALGLATLAAQVAGRRRDLRLPPEPWGVPLLATSLATLGPYLLGRWYSLEAEHALGLLAPALALVLVLALGLGDGMRRIAAPGSWRAAAGVLAALAPLAVAYLTLFDAGEGPLAH
ncbi:MAG: tetratricopeptide repeat protein [Sandaracinaceae bacterium]|nr:tetratricopeptide repeat protein [Sandaracinaceae bacterium]